MVKVHEPKVVEPDALPEALATSNAGLVASAALALNATVVDSVTATGAPVASTPLKPDEKVTGVAATAASTEAVDVFSAVVVLVVPMVGLEATTAKVTGTVSLPPPQATKAATNVRPRPHLAVFVFKMENVFI